MEATFRGCVISDWVRLVGTWIGRCAGLLVHRLVVARDFPWVKCSDWERGGEGCFGILGVVDSPSRAEWTSVVIRPNRSWYPTPDLL